MKSLLAIILFCSLYSQNLQAQLTPNSTLTNLTESDTLSSGVFLIWWDKNHNNNANFPNLSAELQTIADTLNVYRDTAINDLGMSDPSSIGDGHFINVYAFENQGIFSDQGWFANQVRLDDNGYPFLTLSLFELQKPFDRSRAFLQLYQQSSNSPGFDNTGDSAWFRKASADWFAYSRYPQSADAHTRANLLSIIPQVAMWIGDNNQSPVVPSFNLQRSEHQNAMGSYLFYLTEIVGINRQTITEGFYNNQSIHPQEYLFKEVGADSSRQHFVNFASRLTNNLDFLCDEQRRRGLELFVNFGDTDDISSFIDGVSASGTSGWHRPQVEELPGSWGYNVFPISDLDAEHYSFQIRGDEEGSENSKPHFQGKVLVLNPQTGPRFYDMNKDDELTSWLDLDIQESDSLAFMIVASVPELWTGTTEVFGYEANIAKNSKVDTEDDQLKSFSIYPNPVASLLHIESKIPSDRVEVYNVLGSKVYSSNVDGAHNVSGLASGLYTAVVISVNGIVESRVFVKM